MDQRVAEREAIERIESAAEAARKFIIDFGTKAGVTPGDLEKWCYEYSKLTPKERERANVLICAKRRSIAFTEKFGDFVFYPVNLAPPEAL